MFHVPFLTVEDGEDLIASFPLDEDAATSLTLLRTPKFEAHLDEEERGVSVGTGENEGARRELLVSVAWGQKLAEIESASRHFTLSIVDVEPEEVEEAKAVLRKMNYDKRFAFNDV